MTPSPEILQGLSGGELTVVASQLFPAYLLLQYHSMSALHPYVRPLSVLAAACCITAAVPAASPAQIPRPITVVDDLGRTVTLNAPARRIVSLAPSITECLFEIGAGDQVAGVTDYCTAPEAARSKPHVGGMVNPSMETIVNLQPDLVLISMEGNLKEDMLRLTGLQIPVFVTNPRTLQGIRTSIAQLGRLLGRETAAADVVQRMRGREDSLRAAVPAAKVDVLLAVSIRPLMVAGKGTFLHELLEAAGARNLGALARGTYPTLSREMVLRYDPSVLLLLSDTGADSATLQTMFAEWPHLSAVRAGRVYTLNADLFSRPGPRAEEGLALLITLLHKRP
jgi:iron complex transport system substrate-binding protein